MQITVQQAGSLDRAARSPNGLRVVANYWDASISKFFR